jgi:hypothetical protein
MAKYVRNAGKDWTPKDIVTLKSLAREETPMRVIGWMLGRSPKAVRSKAASVGVALKFSDRPHRRANRRVADMVKS